MAIIPANTPWTLNPTMLFESASTPVFVTPSGGPNYWKVSNGARYKYGPTSADLFRITGYTNIAGIGAVIGYAQYGIGILVNGRPFFYPQPLVTGAFDTGWMWLPPGASKTVELFIPGSFANAPLAVGGQLAGVYPSTIMFDQPVTEVTPTIPSTNILVYSTSIAAEALGVNAMFTYANRIKWDGSGRGCVNVSYGARDIRDDCDTQPHAAAFAAFLMSCSPTAIVIDQGTNCWAFEAYSGMTLANFTNSLGWLIDAIRAISSTIPIIVLSPILRGWNGTTEPANAQGTFLSAYRTAIAGVVSARSGLTVPPVYVDCGSIFTDNTYLPDHTHPDTPGTAIQYNFVNPYLPA